jgi:phosphoheptose isomerase
LKAYDRIAGAFHQRIECIAGAVDTLAPGVEQAAVMLTEAVLEDHRVLVLGTGCDAGLAQTLAESLRGGEAGAPPLPAVALARDDGAARDSLLWRDLRMLARDGDVLLCLDSDPAASLAMACARVADERQLALVTIAPPHAQAAGAQIGLLADDAALRRELLLMACHCLQGEIRHLLLGE